MYCNNNNNFIRSSISRGRQLPATTNVDQSSVDLFKQMNPILECKRINDILKDIIYIAVRDSCLEAVKFNDKFKRFNNVDISNMIIKYVDIYIETKDTNVLTILYSILNDTFLYGSEKNDTDMVNFIANIYHKVMSLIPIS